MELYIQFIIEPSHYKSIVIYVHSQREIKSITNNANEEYIIKSLESMKFILSILDLKHNTDHVMR